MHELSFATLPSPVTPSTTFESDERLPHLSFRIEQYSPLRLSLVPSRTFAGAWANSASGLPGAEPHKCDLALGLCEHRLSCVIHLKVIPPPVSVVILAFKCAIFLISQMVLGLALEFKAQAQSNVLAFVRRSQARVGALLLCGRGGVEHGVDRRRRCLRATRAISARSASVGSPSAPGCRSRSRTTVTKSGSKASASSFSLRAKMPARNASLRLAKRPFAIQWSTILSIRAVMAMFCDMQET